MRGEILLLLIITNLQVIKTTEENKQVIEIFKEIGIELTDWVGFDKDLEVVLKECQLPLVEEKVHKLYSGFVEKGENFTKTHIDVIRFTLKDEPKLKQFFRCLIDAKVTDNQFFKKPKYRYLSQFIREHPVYAQNIFLANDKPSDKGFKLGRFLRSFFQFYYLNILNPSETVTTQLLRTITVYSDIFNNEDISHCVSIETSGKIAQNIEGLDIHNIYLRIPEAFNALKYLKFSKKCQDKKYALMAQQLQNRLKNVDMFSIMYTQYEPYVNIAAQKFGSRQIEKIGQLFAEIINNWERYEKMKFKEEL